MALMRTPRGASIRMLSASARPAHTGTNDAGGDAAVHFLFELASTEVA
jgi:hypothetical protein